jgi:precorrin-2 methylase
MKKGTFFVVGTGPGGPDQTTLEALRCIETADLILINRLTEHCSDHLPAAVIYHLDHTENLVRV